MYVCGREWVSMLEGLEGRLLVAVGNLTPLEAELAATTEAAWLERPKQKGGGRGRGKVPQTPRLLRARAAVAAQQTVVRRLQAQVNAQKAAGGRRLPNGRPLAANQTGFEILFFDPDAGSSANMAQAVRCNE